MRSIENLRRSLGVVCSTEKCTNFDLYSISERETEAEGQPQARIRGSAVAEYLTEMVPEDSNSINFDDFVSRFDLEEIIDEYKEGTWRSLMERARLPSVGRLNSLQA